MRMVKWSLLASSMALLSACGSGNDSEIETQQISATLAEDTEWQSDSLFNDIAIVITDASNGMVRVSNNQVTYEPNANFNGTDSAIIEAGMNRYQFSFNVTPVNDQPEVTSNRISIRDNNTYHGELTVSDVDGDEVALSIQQQPERGSIVLGSDYQFTYTLDQLVLPAENFVVTADDGNEPVDIVVDLIPAYTSNAEKSAYYYRSSQSHLKAAEQRMESVTDVITSQDAWASIANGYLIANLPDLAEQTIQAQVYSQQGKAKAFQDLALTYERFDQAEQTHNARMQSFEQYRNYLADNGLNNIRSSDTQFLLGLLNDFRAVNDATGAREVSKFLDTVADELGGINKEYTRTFGYLITGYRNVASSALENYFSNPTKANFETALETSDAAAKVIKKTGYQIKSGGDNDGKIVYKMAPLYASMILENYFLLGEFERVKDMLAWTLSFYTEANYDSEYRYAAKANPDISAQDYDYPLESSARYFELLYPELENLPLALATDELRKQEIQNVINEAQAIAIVMNNNESPTSIEQSIAALKTVYKDDLKGLQEAFSGRTPTIAYTGGILGQLGYAQAAKAMLLEGIQLMTSDAYLAGTNSPLYTTSTRGCFKYMAYARKLDLSDAEAADLRAQILASCNTILDKKFKDISSGVVSKNSQLEAYVDIADLHQLNGETDWQLEQLDKAAQLLKTVDLSDDDEVDTFDNASFRIARAYASSTDVSVDIMAKAVALVEPVVQRWESTDTETYDSSSESQARDVASLLVQLSNVNGDDNTLFARPSLYEQLRVYPNLTNYLTLNDTMSELSERLTDHLIARFESLPATSQMSLGETVIEALATNRRYQAAERLAKLPSFGAAETEFLLTSISQFQALQDDFPNSHVATVDTDRDGLANFYAELASAEEIEESTIKADDDADNDGISDTSDPQPLNAQVGG